MSVCLCVYVCWCVVHADCYASNWHSWPLARLSTFMITRRQSCVNTDTRSSAIAEKPRDALCRLKSCELLYEQDVALSDVTLLARRRVLPLVSYVAYVPVLQTTTDASERPSLVWPSYTMCRRASNDANRSHVTLRNTLCNSHIFIRLRA